MEDDEDVASFFRRVDEIINTMRGLGQKMEEKDVILKILRSLPMRFDAKVSALEERLIIKYFHINELQGVLTVCEMGTRQDKPKRREAAFKVEKQVVKKKLKEECPSCSEESDDEEIENFVRKLKRGTGKYKGKLPLICFNCGKIGHFASKCPYKHAESDDDEDEAPKKETRYHKKNQKKNNQNFFKKKKTAHHQTMITMIVMMSQEECS